MTQERVLLFLIVFHALVGGAVTPFIYARKYRDPQRGLVLGALMGAFGGPLLLAGLWVLVPAWGDQCPKCGKLNPETALVCQFCDYEFLSQVKAKAGSAALGEWEIRADVRQPRVRQGSSFLREVVETVLLIAAIYAFVNLATARFVVEGNSMLPNFNTDQFIIVSRLSYIIGDPQRGDVVVFHYPRQSERDFIKRVIGLPGETITIRAGHVYINGKLIDEPYIENFCRGRSCDGEWDVGENQYFVLGDNRGSSKDSQDFGAVDRKYIIGRAFVRYWPPEDWALVTHHDYAENGAPLPPTPTPAPTRTPTTTPTLSHTQPPPTLSFGGPLRFSTPTPSPTATPTLPPSYDSGSYPRQ